MTHALLLICLALVLLASAVAAAVVRLRRGALSRREAAREAARQRMARHWASQALDERTQLMDGYELARLLAADRP